MTFAKGMRKEESGHTDMSEKTRVIMGEYQGRCDENGVAVGHAPKVLGEYARLLETDHDLQVLAPRCVLESASFAGRKKAKVLPHVIVMKTGNSLREKIWNKVRMFSNISVILHREYTKNVWFFNTEFYLMLYLAIFGSRRKRIVCTMFQDGWHGGLRGRVKQWVFEQAQKKMYRIISAGEDFRFRNVESVYLPDYYCDEKEYGPYRAACKKPEAVCLGTMGAEKQLEEMVACFSRIGYPLTIAGRFYDKERVERLRAMAGENITIRDAYLSREEYLKLLGEASYLVLPYAPEQYGTQTSGVLQEAVFLDTVPVSFRKVLEGNHIPGILFSSWDELQKENFEKDTKEYRDRFARLRKEVYSKEHMKEVLDGIFPDEEEPVPKSGN